MLVSTSHQGSGVHQNTGLARSDLANQSPRSPVQGHQAPQPKATEQETAASSRATSSPSTIFIRSERYTQLQQTLSLSQGNEPAINATAAITEPSEGARQASNNILSFINAQLQRDVQDGASEEALASRIEAGLSGFMQGFSEANAILEDMGLLSDAVSADIQQTYDLVFAGVDELKATYLSEPDSEGAVQAPAVSQVGSRYDEAQSRGFSFNLTTADGDKVAISVSSMRASVTQAYGEQAGGVATLLDYARSQSSRDEFSLTIDGELDADELKAINELLASINQLASDFYNGDVEAAFQKASEIGYDSDEITGFALKLTQTQVQRATSVYQDVGGRSENGTLAADMKPLGHFVQGVMDALQQADQFQDGGSLLTELSQYFERSLESNFQPRLESVVKSLEQ